MAGRLDVFFEGRAVEAPSGSFRDHFEPYGVHVYGTAPLPPPAYRLPDAGNDAGALPKWVRQNRLYDGGAAWIWDAETRNTPSSRAWMMREFSLDGEVKSAILRISADDTADVWLNGVKLGKSGSFTRMASFRELPLQAGVNCLAVDAADGGVLPCGILADLELVLADGTVRHIVSDTEWRSAPSAPQDWTQLQPEWFSRPTAVVAPYGGGAWGNQTRIDD